MLLHKYKYKYKYLKLTIKYLVQPKYLLQLRPTTAKAKKFKLKHETCSLLVQRLSLTLTF